MAEPRIFLALALLAVAGSPTRSLADEAHPPAAGMAEEGERGTLDAPGRAHDETPAGSDRAVGEETGEAESAGRVHDEASGAPEVDGAVALENDTPRARRRGSWFTYGGTILLLDALVVGTTWAIDHPAPVFGYFATGPIVHLAHGHWKRSAISLGVRGGALVGGALLGAAAMEDGGWGAVVGLALGGLVGGTVAVGVDAIWLGRHPPAAPAERPERRTGLSIAPAAGLSHEGFQLGLQGRF